MDHILGDSKLHDRFTAYVEILSHFAQGDPQPANIRDLERSSRRPAYVLRRCCKVMVRDEILEEVPGASLSWRLLKSISDLTLADAFRCATTSAPVRTEMSARSSPRHSGADAASILLMQAMLAIDTEIQKYLRSFSLACLKASSKGALPAPPRLDNASCENRYSELSGKSLEATLTQKDAHYTVKPAAIPRMGFVADAGNPRPSTPQSAAGTI